MNIIILLSFVFLLQIGNGNDMQKQLEKEYAFDYIVQIVSEGRVDSFSGGDLRRCV